MNQHYETAQGIISEERSYGVWASDDTSRIASYLEANMQAALALAYEQRTANLLEWWRLGNIDGASVEQLRERLGMEENQ